MIRNRSQVWALAGRCLAGIAFAYMPNAFVQSGHVGPLELAVGLAWVAACFASKLGDPQPNRSRTG